MEKSVTISVDLYNKLNELGMLPNEVRKDNIGKSNYSKHFIQPWSIWIDYNLNPWDADIVKRVLRTKEEPGMSKKAARIMDYKKIKHICDEQIRQLEFEMISLEDPDGANTLDVDNLEIPTEELTIKDKEILDIFRTLHGKEIDEYIQFCNEHSLCHEPPQLFFKHESGIGQSVIVKCPVCEEERDITDVSNW